MTSTARAPAGSDVTWDGELLRHCLAAAVKLLGRRCETINNLNVFPVPDGDTGTNMLLTMRAGYQAAANVDSRDVGAVASAVARGALLGARGNSGVILSQYLLGFARGLEGCDTLGARYLDRAFQEASARALAAVAKPAEGTILTLAADVARAVSARTRDSADPLTLLEAAVAESEASLRRTREIMPILRQANVVDSGAMGLATILEGMTLAARGEELPAGDDAVIPAPVASRLEPDSYGYCTEFLVRGSDLDFKVIRDRLEPIGDSLLVVGGEDLVRVHVHTFQPGQAIDVALAFGGIEQVKIENMQQQNERIRAGEIDRHAAVAPCGLVVVSVGDGFAQLYRSLGATVVPGGQTLNPSAEEILQGLRRVAAKDCVLLPNNPNVLLTAEQAASLWERRLEVVPTRNLAEGVAAALAFQPSRSAIENAVAMKRGIADVRTGVVTTAIRPAQIDNREVVEGATLGLIGDQIEVVGIDRVAVVLQVLTLLGAASCELVTLYAGDSASDDDAANLSARVRTAFPNARADLIEGGQPHHWFILACE